MQLQYWIDSAIKLYTIVLHDVRNEEIKSIRIGHLIHPCLEMMSVRIRYEVWKVGCVHYLWNMTTKSLSVRKFGFNILYKRYSGALLFHLSIRYQLPDWYYIPTDTERYKTVLFRYECERIRKNTFTHVLNQILYHIRVQSPIIRSQRA